MSFCEKIVIFIDEICHFIDEIVIFVKKIDIYVTKIVISSSMNIVFLSFSNFFSVFGKKMCSVFKFFVKKKAWYLHDIHNDYPLAPEHLIPSDGIISKYNDGNCAVKVKHFFFKYCIN